MFGFASREPWRADAEKACLAQRDIGRTPYIEKVKIKSRGVCGMERPLKASAFYGGSVGVAPAATLGCPMTAAIDRWLAEIVQPAAIAYFGVPVVEIKNISSYSCRTMNNQRGADISEHAFGNALDVAAFTLADRRTVTVLKGWKGDEAERGFLREAHGGACTIFSTVLGPGADRFHSDHFHLDLAQRRSGRSYCQPAAQRQLLPNVYRGVPMVRGPGGGESVAFTSVTPGLQPITGAAPASPTLQGYGYPQPGYTQPQPNYGYAQPRPEPFGSAPTPPMGVPMGYAPAN
jgi:hypothetical protein